MPNSMSLGGEKQAQESIRIPDNVFAIHALACIKLHDDERNEKYNRSLSYLASADEHLRYAKGSLLLSYLLTFGRHSEPLLTKTLVSKFNYAPEEIDKQVGEIHAKLAPVVFSGD